jgi:hypothetical protein
VKLKRIIHDIRTDVRNRLGIKSRSILCTDHKGTEIIQHNFTERIKNDWEYSAGLSQEKFIDIVYPAAVSLNIDNVYITGDCGFVFVNKKYYISDKSEGLFTEVRKIRHPIPSLADSIKGTVFHLSGANFENHGHFLTQFLPRVLLKKDLFEASGEMKVMIAPNVKKWQSRYLNFLGIDQAQYVTSSVGTVNCEKMIYIPFFHGDNSLVPGKYYRELRQYFSPQPINKKYKAIFLTRKHAPDRSIINEEEVIKEIEEVLGDKVLTVDLSILTLKEQIHLANSSEFIIGAQGQALAIQLFAHNAKVVVIDVDSSKSLSRDWAKSYRDLAIHLGHSAIRLYAPASTTKRRDWVYPINVFREEFSRAVESVC